MLRGPAQPYVTRRDFFDAMQTYARGHRKDGKPYIGEYFDEITGDWLITGPKAARSRDYNHSTFCDLVIRGLVGIVPRDDDIVEVDPLVAAGHLGLVLPRWRALSWATADDRLGPHRQPIQSRRRSGHLGGWKRNCPSTRPRPTNGQIANGSNR